MSEKRHKLRLRKQVILCIPILFFVLILSVCLVLGKKKEFVNEVSPYDVAVSPLSEMEGTKFSELELMKNFENAIDIRQRDNTVIYYANVFKLNIDLTLDVVHEFTNNYSSELYLTTNVIGPTSVVEANGSFDSFEAGVVYFVRDFYRYPEKYGKSLEEVRTDESSTLKTVSEDGNIYMDNGLTFPQYVGKICSLYGLDPSFVLAIIYEETGIMTSGLFRLSNNVGGIKGYDGWMSFTTLESGVIAHVLMVKSIYTRFNIDVNDPNAEVLFSGVYVNGLIDVPAWEWLGKVQYFQGKINEKDLFSI